ncbi:MAG: branched-chain amino acid aminotransferase, partial [Pseudomonadota bacterium]
MAFGTIIKTWVDGVWHEGNVPIMGAADHGTWQGTMVFDGARMFEGVTPDLDLHATRILRSAAAMGMTPPGTAEEIVAAVREGLTAFPTDMAVYIRPMMWSTEGGRGIIAPVPESCRMAICLEDIPMVEPGELALTVSPFLRPDPRAAITEAKSGALYANNGRILREAQERGFDNALSLDPWGNVAETASTNVFLVRGGVVATPKPNGTLKVPFG